MGLAELDEFQVPKDGVGTLKQNAITTLTMHNEIWTFCHFYTMLDVNVFWIFKLVFIEM